MPYEVELFYPREISHSDIEEERWWKHLLAGGLAGAISRTLTAPIDRLKIFFQAHYLKNSSWSQTIKDIMVDGGFLSFWRGNCVSIMKVAPEMASKFLAYETAKRSLIEENSRTLTLFDRFVAGAIAGCISQSVIYPFDVLKTKVALKKKGELKSTFPLVRSYYKTHGAKFFFRGYLSNIVGVILFAGIDLSLYETMKEYFTRNERLERVVYQPSISTFLLCGLISSAVSQMTTYPFALVTTAMQTDESILEYKFLTKYKRVLGAIWRGGGWIAFFRGVSPTLIKGVPSICISYIVYEFTLNHLGGSMT